MNTEKFQNEVARFYEEETTEETLFLGLASEVGEVMQARVKETRKGLECTAEILDELGDVLWYVSTISQSRGYSLADIMKDVLDKLSVRNQKEITSKNFDKHGSEVITLKIRIKIGRNNDQRSPLYGVN
jgi:NTP pyrophosphatase (non-canonical NTP hydrolase)